MDSDLTIIIPFLNEGEEIQNTVDSILETCETMPYIILINDGSNDGYNYESIIKTYKNRISIIYIYHKKRIGVAASRDEGVRNCKTSYFLLLDGHMRFYEHGWDSQLIDLLKTNKRSLLCGQTRALAKDLDGEITTDNHALHYGAYINFDNFDAVWNGFNIEPTSNIVEIPCVLGAAYAMEKAYWTYLNGLYGLQSYGMDEQLISLKVWLEGGRCLLVKDWVVGHIYRTNFPYTNPKNDFMYNKMFLAQLLFPFSIKQKIFERFKLVNSHEFEKSYSILKINYQMLKKEQKYLKSIFTKSFNDFKNRNNAIQRSNNLK